MRKPKNTKVTYSAFDVSEHLDNETVIAQYLTSDAQDDNSDVLISAISNVALAHGMAQVAKYARLGRESLYKALRPSSKPRHETIAAIMRSMGVQFSILPNQ